MVVSKKKSLHLKSVYDHSLFSQTYGCFAPRSHKEKAKKPNKSLDANHIEKKPDFINLASKNPNWKPES